jgi:omega-6 fatty acid desaturase (delta-12 desaturase)
MSARPLEIARAPMPAMATRELRAALEPYARGSLPVALATVAADIAVFLGLIAATVYFDHWALKLACAIAAGTAISRLFVIGHDAVHLGFTHSKRLDSIIGRIVFLPALHNFSLWRIAHNRNHHLVTNVQGYNSWSPLSLGEYSKLSAEARLLYRFYRSPLGLGPYYLVERWWKDKFFPTRRVVGTMKPAYWWDFALTLVFLAAWIGALLWAAAPASVMAALGTLFFGFALPFALWNYLMGFTVYFQHTNARVPWYRTPADARGVATQEDVSVHVKFPFWYEFLSHYNMNHAAHHVSPKIPIYRLKAAQAHLNALLGPRAVIVKFTPMMFWRTMAQCKLYNYASHRWVDFKGRSVDVPVPESARTATTAPKREATAVAA